MQTQLKKKIRRRARAGAAPGTLIHLGERKVDSVRITLIDYSEDALEERELQSINECKAYLDKNSISWINIDGLHDVELFEKVGELFGVHPLILEDCLNTRQRPRLDDQEDYLFVALKMLSVQSSSSLVEREQISLIVGNNFVLSFQEREGDVFTAVRERIRSGKGRIRKAKADYLAYALVDAIVDHYFIVIDEFNEQIDLLDTKVLDEPTPELLQQVYSLKREIVNVRRGVTPLREVLSRLYKGDPNLVSDSTQIYFGDVLDHLLQVVESIDASREILSGLIDIYLSSVSNRTNDIMKVLTIMAAIFIPITFIAGVYGMNFERIPELEWEFGYLYVWAVMISVVGGMLLYFKKREWL